MFSEAKRHKPSIIYLPNLMLWAHSVSELVKATFKGLLDAMDPSEPILLMAVVDGLLKDVPSDIRSWFGFVRSNRVLIERPAAVSCLTLLRSQSVAESDVYSHTGKNTLRTLSVMYRRHRNSSQMLCRRRSASLRSCRKLLRRLPGN